MPATCFDGPPRGAGVSAAALAPELAAALRGVVCYRAVSAVRSELCAPEGYKCMHRRAARRLAPVFAALRCSSLLGLLVSYMPLARLECASAKQQGLTQANARKWCTVTVQIRPRSINRLRIARGPSSSANDCWQ